MHTVKRIVKGFFCFCLCCVVLVLGINFYVILSTKPMIKETKDLQDFNAEFVLVLGCGVRSDGSPSHMLWERLKTGREVLEQCSETTKLLLSGDNSGSYNEPQTMQRVSLENGVSDDRIVIDDFGFSTFESILNARNNFGANRIVIITQPYHMYRALYIAKHLGIQAVGITADLPFYPMQIWWSAREILARDKDAVQCIIRRTEK